MAMLRSGAIAPTNPFPLLPLRTGVLFPGTTITLPAGRARSLAMLDTLRPGAVIGVVAQKNPEAMDPTADELYDVGTYARIVRLDRAKDRGYRVVLEGLDRFRLLRLVTDEPFWLAEGEALEETGSDTEEAKLLAEGLFGRLKEIAQQGGNIAVAADVQATGRMADQLAAALGLPVDREYEVLATLDVPARLRRVAELLTEARASAELKQKIEADVRKEFGKHQRDALLREQLRAIRKEIGDDKGEDELGALRERLDKAELPTEARAVADRELRRLEAVPAGQMEHNVIRSYLEWIADLPWTARASAKDDLDAVSKKLDEDHWGLTDVKRRILEHIAVLKLSGNPRGTLLCLAGPPGVGKTSLGQSIADATGRPFVRISLGGVRDEAEVRGHRRTYVGALPGRILHALRKAKVRNPVVLLDEVDKLGTGWGGSPEAALLEVLDPEQNKSFVDHYLELPFDLSEVLFICTANTLDTLSPPLRDRLEIIEVTGYTADEKTHIARRHLLPRQLREHSLPEGSLAVTDEALTAIVKDYTREAGVRQLTREITKLCRAVALEIARAPQGETTHLTVHPDALEKYLGKVRFHADIAERTAVPGVATGLAWTPVGGDILFIETSRMPGKGKLEITGQLGDVMKESARAAMTYVRSNAAALGVHPAFLEDQDVHIHVPAGAVPKDGPSAGVTIFTALTSLLTGRRVRPDTAMTGECTLRGRVMPVGGIKSKVLAAHRAGITRVILPSRNARDIDDVPEDVRSTMDFIFADDMTQVLDAALEASVAPANETTVGGPQTALPTRDQPTAHAA